MVIVPPLFTAVLLVPDELDELDEPPHAATAITEPLARKAMRTDLDRRTMYLVLLIG
jgi:hypothetical protein